MARETVVIEQEEAAFSRMREFVEADSGRLVVNSTVSRANLEDLYYIYERVSNLQDLALRRRNSSEVLFTFSPQIWDEDRARAEGRLKGRLAAKDPALRHEDFEELNGGIGQILDDTYQRVGAADKKAPRVLGNSSGYAHLYSERAFWDTIAELSVGQVGQSVQFNVTRSGKAPPPSTPHLPHPPSALNLMDREADPVKNRFSDFHHGNYYYFPNIVQSGRGGEGGAPIRMMDRRLARMIVDTGVIRFGINLRNKFDSPHTMGDPRRLGTNPFHLRYLGERALKIAHYIGDDVETVVGISSFGESIAAVTAELSTRTDRPLNHLYVKLRAEEHKGKKLLEGNIDVVADTAYVLIDDLVFHGFTSRQAMENTRAGGMRKAARGLIFVVNRQLQRPDKGPSLEEDGYNPNSMITMDEIIGYMIEKEAIRAQELQDVIHDYLLFDRHDPMTFLQGVPALNGNPE